MSEAAPAKSTNVRQVRWMGAALRLVERASPQLATQAAWKLWTTPRRYPQPERE